MDWDHPKFSKTPAPPAPAEDPDRPPTGRELVMGGKATRDEWRRELIRKEMRRRNDALGESATPQGNGREVFETDPGIIEKRYRPPHIREEDPDGTINPYNWELDAAGRTSRQMKGPVIRLKARLRDI